MCDSQRVTLSQSTHLIGSSRSVRIIMFNKTPQTNLSTIRTCEYSSFMWLLPVLCMIHFLYADRKQ